MHKVIRRVGRSVGRWITYCADDGKVGHGGNEVDEDEDDAEEVDLVPEVLKVQPVVGVQLEGALDGEEEHEDDLEDPVDRERGLEHIRGGLLAVHLINQAEKETDGSTDETEIDPRH